MTTKKVLMLNETEINAIMACGKLLRDIDNGLKDGSIDELAPDTVSLIKAVQQVSQEVISTTATTEEA